MTNKVKPKVNLFVLDEMKTGRQWENWPLIFGKINRIGLEVWQNSKVPIYRTWKEIYVIPTKRGVDRIC